jgi:hypothetical protein
MVWSVSIDILPELLTYHMYKNDPPTLFYWMSCKLLSTLSALQHLLRLVDFHASVTLDVNVFFFKEVKISVTEILNFFKS